MSYLLDTDTCLSAIRNSPRVTNRFSRNVGNLHVSVVSITELEMWLLRSGTPIHYGQGFFSAMRQVRLMDVTEPVAHRAAMIGSGLRSRGRRSGLADLLIAAL